MKITKRVLAVILAALFAVAAFAGCSASGKDDSANQKARLLNSVLSHFMTRIQPTTRTSS